MTEKLDLFKKHKVEFAAPKNPKFIEMGTAHYLAIEGQGEPGGAAFEARIGALYAMAFTIKMTRKFEGLGDYVVCKLECQWWGKDENDSSDLGHLPMDQWNWRMLIRTPDFVEQGDLDKAAKVLLEKGKAPEVKDVKMMTLNEGLCVQMLHVGPYDREGETVEKMLAFADEEGFKPHGVHHEIYISDPRRVPPERLKTILRLPLKKK